MPFEDMRQQIELKLRGELLRDWCRELAREDESVSFADGWCSGQQAIRFCTRAIDALVGEWRGSGDCWNLGHLAFYEVRSSAEEMSLALVVSGRGMPKDTAAKIDRLTGDLGGSIDLDSDTAVTLRVWPLASGFISANVAVGLLDATWREQVLPFERTLSAWLLDGEKPRIFKGEEKPAGIADADVPAEAEDVPSPVGVSDREPTELEPLIEGAELATISNRFERNRQAREQCLAAHGAVCAICGFDFGKAYGPSFAGIIDVHHRVPLNEIREDYVVDPVRDLVPVCPNCHRVLHSKPDGGVYTVDEVRALLECGR